MTTTENISDHHLLDPLGRLHRALDFLYLCDAHEPGKGYWMTRTDDPSVRRNVSERALGGLFRQVSESDMEKIEFLQLFSQALPQAVIHHEAGFYFEEGGCWGMAQALYECFEEHRLNPAILVREGSGAHAMVRSLDGAYDHAGMGRIQDDARVVSSDELKDVAARNGVSGDDWKSDAACARCVVKSALEAIDSNLIRTAGADRKSGAFRP